MAQRLRLHCVIETIVWLLSCIDGSTTHEDNMFTWARKAAPVGFTIIYFSIEDECKYMRTFAEIRRNLAYKKSPEKYAMDTESKKMVLQKA